MYILVYVIAMLMLMGTVTYASFAQFLGIWGRSVEFRHYSEVSQYKFLNVRALRLYKNASVTDPLPVGLDVDRGDGYLVELREPSSRTYLFTKLPFDKLVDEGPNNPQYDVLFELLKSLIRELYGESRFFRRVQERIPDLEDQMVREMTEKASTLREEKKLNHERDLAHLHLGDSDLHLLYYRMLKGVEGGYPSLLKFLRLSNSESLISLYKAPRPLLMAIFQDEGFVEQVMQEREAIARKVRSKKLSKEEGSKELEAVFAGKLFPGGDMSLYDFRVNTSWPKR